jgi:hypothetical protein
VRRFTLITIIVLLVVLLAVGIWQLSLGTSVRDRIDRNSPSPTPGS